MIFSSLEERVSLLLEPFYVVAASLRRHGVVSSRREDGVGESRHAPALTFSYYMDMLRELPRATGLKRSLSWNETDVLSLPRLLVSRVRQVRLPDFRAISCIFTHGRYEPVNERVDD